MRSGAIHHTQLELMPRVELYVYAVKGKRYSVIIDTGITQMREQLLKLEEVGFEAQVEELAAEGRLRIARGRIHRA